MDLAAMEVAVFEKKYEKNCLFLLNITRDHLLKSSESFIIKIYKLL